MDIEFSEEQLAIGAVARELFEKACAPDRLRARWEDPTPDRDLWRQMSEVGILGLVVPEEHGGMGGDETDLLLVLEAAGANAVPDPILETAVVALTLADVGGEPAAAWLPGIAAGSVVATVLLGDAPYAVAGTYADVALVEVAGDLHLLDLRDVPAAGRPTVPTQDRLRHLAVLPTPDGAPFWRSNDHSGARSEVARAGARARAAWGTGALLSGVARRLLDMSVTYAKDREQFGTPIGAFQAVAHKLASVVIEQEAAHSALRYAAYALAHDLDDAPVAVAAAKCAANDAAHLANTEALQVHGGIGFTWEHDLHIWLKRGRALEQAHGSSREHRRTLAAHLIDGGSAT